VRLLRLQDIDDVRALASTSNGRVPWWNAGASDVNQAFPKSYFWWAGQVSLLQVYSICSCVLFLNRRVRIRTHGGVRGGIDNIAAYPIWFTKYSPQKAAGGLAVAISGGASRKDSSAFISSNWTWFTEQFRVTSNVA